jgi:hypothetical protein
MIDIHSSKWLGNLVMLEILVQSHTKSRNINHVNNPLMIDDQSWVNKNRFS